METSGFENNVCIYFIRSAKPVNYCQPHIFCGKSLYVSVTFAVPEGSRTLAKESIWDVASPSNTSSSARKTRSTRFLRYLSSNLLDNLSLPGLHTAALPGNHRLETPVSPQHFAFAGSFHLHGSLVFPHCLRLDGKRGRDAIHQIQSRGKPFAVGEPTRYFLAGSDLTIIDNLQLSGVMAGTAYLHDLGIVHRDLKGVQSIIHNIFFKISLTCRAGKHPR